VLFEGCQDCLNVPYSNIHTHAPKGQLTNRRKICEMP
jgi:hypothetical protein